MERGQKPGGQIVNGRGKLGASRRASNLIGGMEKIGSADEAVQQAAPQQIYSLNQGDTGQRSRQVQRRGFMIERIEMVKEGERPDIIAGGLPSDVIAQRAQPIVEVALDAGAT